LAAAAAAQPIFAEAVIRGIVVENQTGRPLARTLIQLSTVSGSAHTERTVRTDLSGGFTISELPAGAFLVSASRKGFATMQYGQKQFRSAGLPIILEENQRVDIEIRLPRMGAIAGRIVDENDVGLPDHDIVIYRLARPPLLASRATTDDRGIFRVPGLEPGTYVARTTAKVYEEGGYLPTFFHDVSTVDQARWLEVTLDAQVEDVAIRPHPGRLFRLSGVASCPRLNDLVTTVTLVSDMGKETVNVDPLTGKYQFNPQAPGKYELNLVGIGSMPCYGYQEVDLDKDLTDIRISGTQMPTLRTMLEDSRGGRVDLRAVQLMARRKELSGPGEVRRIDLSEYSNSARIVPGRWEFALAPSPAYYAQRFQTSGNMSQERADQWNEAPIVSGYAQNVIKFVVSASPGAVHGAVTLGSQIAIGAPVFLESSDIEPGKRYKEPLMVRTDTRGLFQFSGLAPGNYRLLATFEYQNPTAAEFDQASAVRFKIEETRDLVQDLTLFVAR
jgi:hypothetical protein